VDEEQTGPLTRRQKADRHIVGAENCVPLSVHLTSG
jgi:hypothetical protein